MSSLAMCDPDLSGSWVLDYPVYLDNVSKGDADVRRQIDEVWGGEAFIKFTFDSINRGQMSQRSKHGWTSAEFSYQITVDTSGHCTITFGFDDPEYAASYESSELWSSGDGFCWKSASAPFEDCYIIDDDLHGS